MKRFMMTAVAALLFSAVAGYNYYQHSQIDPRILENAAAMADNPAFSCSSDCSREACPPMRVLDNWVYMAYCYDGKN